MKLMTKLETIIMNRTGCNRETANLVANDIIDETENANRKSIDDVMICPHCKSEDCYEYSTDELCFDANCTGFYYVDCHCKSCNNNFRLCTEFEYSITKSHTRS
jgi:DNA-directed RNA polymerase subunit M/transcription elongation factor TFIIS